MLTRSRAHRPPDRKMQSLPLTSLLECSPGTLPPSPRLQQLGLHIHMLSGDHLRWCKVVGSGMQHQQHSSPSFELWMQQTMVELPRACKEVLLCQTASSKGGSEHGSSWHEGSMGNHLR